MNVLLKCPISGTIREAYALNESKPRKHRIQETKGPIHEGVEGISQNEGKVQS